MSKAKIAVFGAGAWGRNIVRTLSELGHLVAVCDPSEACLDATRKIVGDRAKNVRWSVQTDDILKDNDIAGVMVATPAETHYEVGKKVLAAGKDLFVEKPFCLKIEDAEELTALARQHGRILMVGHLLQYHPHVRQLQALVASGTLGSVRYITSNRLSLGKFRREENVLWSLAPHDLSIILSLAGDQLPEKVACAGSGLLTSGVEDVVVVNLAFAGGLRAHVYASWVSPFKEQKLTVVGSKALAVFDDTKPWPEKLALYRNYVEETSAGPTPRKTAAEFADLPEAEPLRAECQHFLDCCRNRQAPRTDGAEGSRVLRVLQAAQSSLGKDGAPLSP